jgi:DNA-binding PadR family transcriptional regulator
LSPQAEAVVLALAQDPAAWRYGYELVTGLKIKSGSLYPILIRLAERDLLETKWEPVTEPGRPPRHLYRLTESGREVAAAVAARPGRHAVTRPRVVPEGPETSPA